MYGQRRHTAIPRTLDFMSHTPLSRHSDSVLPIVPIFLMKTALPQDPPSYGNLSTFLLVVYGAQLSSPQSFPSCASLTRSLTLLSSPSPGPAWHFLHLWTNTLSSLSSSGFRYYTKGAGPLSTFSSSLVSLLPSPTIHDRQRNLHPG